MKRSTVYLLIALAFSALKNITVPDRYNYVICGQQANNLIYFVGIDLVILFLALTIRSLSKHDKLLHIVSNAATWLAFGKLIDEAVQPYGYHFAELIFDALIIGMAIWQYIIYNRNSTTNR